MFYSFFVKAREYGIMTDLSTFNVILCFSFLYLLRAHFKSLKLVYEAFKFKKRNKTLSWNYSGDGQESRNCIPFCSYSSNNILVLHLQKFFQNKFLSILSKRSQCFFIWISLLVHWRFFHFFYSMHYHHKIYSQGRFQGLWLTVWWLQNRSSIIRNFLFSDGYSDLVFLSYTRFLREISSSSFNKN